MVDHRQHGDDGAAVHDGDQKVVEDEAGNEDEARDGNGPVWKGFV